MILLLLLSTFVSQEWSRLISEIFATYQRSYSTKLFYCWSSSFTVNNLIIFSKILAVPHDSLYTIDFQFQVLSETIVLVALFIYKKCLLLQTPFQRCSKTLASLKRTAPFLKNGFLIVWPNKIFFETFTIFYWLYTVRQISKQFLRNLYSSYLHKN